MCNDILVLAPNGRLVYHGRRDESEAYFARLGHPIPPNTNPAEHLIDLVSVDQSDGAETRAADEARVSRLVQMWAEHEAELMARRRPRGDSRHQGMGSKADKAAEEDFEQSSSVDGGDIDGDRRRRRPRFLMRLGLLARRSWRQNVRDGWVNGLRLAASAGLALLFGEIFGSVGAPTASSVAERIALLSYASINMAMMALMKTLDLFGRERGVIQRERGRGQYSETEYVLAKLLTELPIDAAFAAGFGALLHRRCGLRLPMASLVGTLALTAASCAGLGLAIGAVAPSADAALALGIPAMILFMVVGVINPSGEANTKPPSTSSAASRRPPQSSGQSLRSLCLSLTASR